MLTNQRLGAAHSAVELFPQVLDQASHNGSIDSETVDAIRPLASAGPIPDRVNTTPLLDFYWSGKDFFLAPASEQSQRRGKHTLLGVERGSRSLCPEGAIRLSPGLNGAKIRHVWDSFLPRRGYGIQPRVSTLGTIQTNGSP
jgi:hypothetical protein